MVPYRPERVYVEKEVRDSPISRNVLENLPGTPVEEIDSRELLLGEARRRIATIAQGKRALVLARHRGRFFKPCPGSTARNGGRNACCNYFVINYASNCHMECTYCYLQAYLNLPYMVVYANCGDLLEELEEVFARRPGDLLRVGTGELADSLALDRLTGYSRPLVRFFARQRNGVLELKTKSNCVENLLDLAHGGKTVVSWSISPPFVQEHEEHKTAAISERLEAAEKCVAAGYPVAFHLDPLIHYDGWQPGYSELIREIFGRIPAASIRWISLGGLRMPPRLRDLIRERFPSSFLPYGELVPAEDGKLRYFKPIRLEMYRRVLGWIRLQSPDTQVYTCMEGAGVWSRVFDTAPPGERELGGRLVADLVTL